MKLSRLFFYFSIFLTAFPSAIVFADSPQVSPTPSQPHAGFIDVHGKIVIPMVYDSVGEFHEGFAWVQKNGKFGFIDTSGNVIIDFKFDGTDNFKEGLGEVKIGKKYGFVNKAGVLVIPVNFDSVRYFSEDLAAARNGKLWGFINKKGDWVIKPQYGQVGNFSEGLASVSPSGWFYHFIDKTGTTVISEKEGPCDYPPTFINGYAQYHRCSGAPSFCSDVYVDKTGTEIFIKTLQNTMQEVDGVSGEGEPIISIDTNLLKNSHQELPFTEGLSIFEGENFFGFCDRDGKVVIGPQFEDVDNFSSGLARVEFNGKWGFIDHKGAWVIKPLYSEAENFFGDYAYVKKDDKSEGFVDTKGDFFPAPYLTKYNSFKRFSEGLMGVSEKSNVIH
jgi:hypothetical protein